MRRAVLIVVVPAVVVGGIALAEGFTFTIGSPVASQDFQAKGAAFVLRTEGCADPPKLQVGGSAEGMVKEARRSVPLRVIATSKPGVYAVYQTWPAEGHWVVNLKGTCASSRSCSGKRWCARGGLAPVAVTVGW